MRPKGKLFALFAVFAAIGLVTASGAFTTVAADRTAEVDTAGDANALLAITPTNDAYADNASGEVEINLNGDFEDAGSGQGVNLNATTEVDGVINITNQGSQPVWVYIERSGGNETAVEFYNGTSYSNNANITTADHAKKITAGDGFQVSMRIDTTGEQLNPNAELLQNITIYANATEP